MLYQRLLLANLALVYCVCIGLFALIQNHRAPLNRYFALYNFSNALYNAADWVILIPNHQWGVWWVRFAGVGGSLMIPFLMLFVFELTEVAQLPTFRTLRKWGIRLGIFFVLMHFTPFMIRDAYIPEGNFLRIEIPGILYPFFAIFTLSNLAAIVWSLIQIKKHGNSYQKQKLTYVILACLTGALAFAAYFLNFVGHDLPIVYYSLQALVAFIFSYAIFKHNLIPLSVALRRTLLIVGIYILIGILVAPLFIIMRQSILLTGSWSALLLLVGIAGALFSLGPVIYGNMVQRSSLFQDNAASHVAHEFRTPLHAIQNAKAILEEELAKPTIDSAKVHDYMNMIERNANRLETFVAEILTTVKAGEGRSTLNKTPCDLVLLVREAMDQFPTLQHRHQVKADPLPQILLDKEAIFQVITNLISNAAKFAPSGFITITLRETKGGVEVAVADQGEGIPNDELHRVFEPFAQSKGNTLRSKGTGLGLAIAKRWIEAHGGKIWAESEGIGKGARFVFFLK